MEVKRARKENSDGISLHWLLAVGYQLFAAPALAIILQ
jgi:hypothetical protein